MATQAEILERYTLYKNAETAILSGAQEYRVEDKLFRKADLGLIQKELRRLEGELAGKDPAKKRMRAVRILPKRF